MYNLFVSTDIILWSSDVFDGRFRRTLFSQGFVIVIFTSGTVFPRGCMEALGREKRLGDRMGFLVVFIVFSRTLFS